MVCCYEQQGKLRFWKCDDGQGNRIDENSDGQWWYVIYIYMCGNCKLYKLYPLPWYMCVKCKISMIHTVGIVFAWPVWIYNWDLKLAAVDILGFDIFKWSVMLCVEIAFFWPVSHTGSVENWDLIILSEGDPHNWPSKTVFLPKFSYKLNMYTFLEIYTF